MISPTAPLGAAGRWRPLVLLLACLAVLAASCSSGGSDLGADNAANRDGADASTTSVPDGDGLLDVPTTAAGDGGGEDGGGSDDGGDGGDDGERPLEPNEYGAPYPGTYQYEIGDDGDLARFDVYDTAEDRRRELQQLQHFIVERRADAQLVEWESDGMYVTAEQAMQPDGSQGALCRWEPRYLEVPRPAEVGRQWSIDSSCPAGEDLTRRRVGTATVVGTDRVAVGGTTVDVVVIERRYDTTVRSSDGVLDAGQRHSLTDRWAPTLGLLVRSEGTVATTVQGVPNDPAPYFRRLLEPVPVQSSDET